MNGKKMIFDIPEEWLELARPLFDKMYEHPVNANGYSGFVIMTPLVSESKCQAVFIPHEDEGIILKEFERLFPDYDFIERR